ncbi:MAG: DUF3667 domain-containing protein [Flavisolibacter sp.]|nr:DUF3667 domain-containing protein [Flavisolibacter sp.]
MRLSCKNCGNNFTGNYCNNCGEKLHLEKDKKISLIIGDAFHFITHFEGNFFNTLKAVITRPGKLSRDYCNGKRKSYFKPISFFLMLVILYLLFPLFEGLNMKLTYHAKHNAYGGYATRKIEQLLESRGWTEAYLTDIFQSKGEKTSKFLLFIVLPVMACFSYLLAIRKRRFYFDHFIFSTEVISVFIFWGFLLLPVLLLMTRAVGINPFSGEDQVALTILSVFFVYLTLAGRRFFGFTWWYALFYALLFSFIFVIFLEMVYKFLLFFIVIHLV